MNDVHVYTVSRKHCVSDEEIVKMANRVSAAEKIAAMSLYGDRRRRTAVIRLDQSITGLGVVRRADVLEMLDKAVRRQSVEAVGQFRITVPRKFFSVILKQRCSLRDKNT